jgi:DNA-binding transcriptional LysR family regulator
MTVEIRHLRAFLAIAEERSLTRAAVRLHITQPALSRTLAQLERDVSVRLVDRSTHHVELTDAGRKFEQLAFDAVRAFEGALIGVDGRGTPLRLGHNWSAGTFLSGIVREWNRCERSCPLLVVRGEDRSAGLTSGKADIALTRGPVDPARFRTEVIAEEARVAVLPAGHRLARKRRLALDDLAELTLIGSTMGTTTPALWPDGRRPVLGAEVNTMDDWLVAIATGAGFSVTVASTAVLHPHPDVRYVPLADAPPVPLMLAWPRRNPHPAVKELLQVERETATPSRGT